MRNIKGLKNVARDKIGCDCWSWSDGLWNRSGYIRKFPHHSLKSKNFINFQAAAIKGFHVTLVDLNQDLLDKSKLHIEKILTRVARRNFKDDQPKIDEFVQTSMTRVAVTTNLLDAVKTADLVIEAIIENLEAKQKMFQSIDDVAKSTTIFASNTSSLPISLIAKKCKRLDRFCGLHFFNPVAMMELLEVIRTPETSEATYQAIMEFGKKLGKTCVTCKDTPGFIVNRLLSPYLSEAIRMLEQDVATKEDIDAAMKLGAGHPMGPFELCDLVGLDVIHNANKFYHQQYPDVPYFTPSSLVDTMVKEGKLGVKSGEGFYSYK